MKRLVSLLLCGCLLLLSGCGQAEEAFSYYPHSDTLRLDASAEEVFAAQEMVLLKDYGEAQTYVSAEPVQIGGVDLFIKCTDYSPDAGLDDSNHYELESAESDLSAECAALKKHFSKTYGKPDAWQLEPYSTNKDEFTSEALERFSWVFSIDTGEKYTIRVMRNKVSDNDTMGYHITIITGKWSPNYEKEFEEFGIK